jgi:ABC-type multidrug transport system fused ATPase/permease subunit
MKRILLTISFVLNLFREIGLTHKAVFTAYILSFYISLFYGVSSIMIPYLFKKLSGQLAFTDFKYSIESIINIATIYCFVWFIAQISEQLREIVVSSPLHKAVSKVISDVYSKKLKNYLFYNERSTGNQIALFSMFQECFPNFVTGFFYYLIPLVIQLFVISIVLGVQCGWMYSIVFTNLLVILFLVTYARIKRFILLQEESLSANLVLFDHLTDRYTNFETVMLFGSHAYETKLLSQFLSDAEKKQIESHVYLEKTRLYQGLIFSIALICITYLAVYDIAQNHAEFTDFLMLNAYILQIVSPLSSLSFILTDLSRGIVTVEHFLSSGYKQQENKGNNLESNNVLKPINTLEFCNVSYGYQENQPIFEKISFKVQDKKTIFLIGESGTGKSTLGKLLCFLYQFQQGQILLNGICSKKYSIEGLRSQFSMVPQSIHLFNDTLLNNILYANPSASLDQVKEVLYVSCLDEWVESLEQGLNTHLGELGKNISGGQRQRIALARALLKNSSVLILDEFTSHIDTLTIVNIRERLKKFKPNLIIFLITHQIEILTENDYIILLTKGSRHAQGTHKELLENNYLYKSMISSLNELIRRDNNV